MELIPFVFYKVIVAVILVVMWAWPPVVGFVAWLAAEDCSSGLWKRFWKGVIVVLGGLGAMTYWIAMVPDPLPLKQGRPADAAYHFTFHLGYKEYVAGKEAEKPPKRTELGTELRRYRLDDWDPPKHFYVDITDLKTGESFEHLYVSKHCNDSGQLQRGHEYNILLKKYSLSSRPGEVLYEFPSLYPVFC